MGTRATVGHRRRRKHPFTCIVHVSGSHFVALADLEQDLAQIIDPPNQYTLPLQTFERSWDGNALLLANDPLEPDLENKRPGATAVAVSAVAALSVILIVAYNVMSAF